MNPAGYDPRFPGAPGQYPYPPQTGYAPFPPPRPKRRIPVWGWVLIVIGGVVALSCGGFLTFAWYIGTVGPDTKVYTGNEVPKRFTDTARQLKLLDAGEQVKFFYSDALKDVREGMYFATDKKVVVYIADAEKPTTVVPYEKIQDASFTKGSGMLEDSSITLTLEDGSVVAFPVSTEGGRDKLMFDAIESSRKAARSRKAGRR
jgi:hypothetical protein